MKYREAGLIQSSAGRGWQWIIAELRRHAPGLSSTADAESMRLPIWSTDVASKKR